MDSRGGLYGRFDPAEEGFLIDDGRVFISSYETYGVADVECGNWLVGNPGKDLPTGTYHDLSLKELRFQKLINDNEVTQAYQGLIPRP